MDLRSHEGEYVSVLCSDEKKKKIKVSLRIIFFRKITNLRAWKASFLTGLLS